MEDVGAFVSGCRRGDFAVRGGGFVMVATESHHGGMGAGHVGVAFFRYHDAGGAEGRDHAFRRGVVGGYGEFQDFSLVVLHAHGPDGDVQGHDFSGLQEVFMGTGDDGVVEGGLLPVQCPHGGPLVSHGPDGGAGHGAWDGAALGVQFLYGHGEVYVAAALRFHPEVEFHVSRELRVLIEGEVEGRALPVVGGVGDGAFFRLPAAQCVVRGEVEFLIGGVRQGPPFFYAVRNVCVSRVQYGNPDAGGLFPAVVFALQVVVEEFPEFLHVGGGVVVVPFVGVVDPEPFVMAGELMEGGEGAVGVDVIGIAGHHVGGDGDPFGVGDLVFPVGVQEGVGHHHAGLVFDVVLAGKGLEDGLRKYGVRDAAAVGGFPEVVHESFPGGDGGQVLRLFAGNEPLGYGEVGVPGHAYFSVGPGLGGDPFDGVTAILRQFAAPVVHVSFGVVRAPGVRVHDGVAMGHPVGGVRAFEFLEVRHPVLRHAAPAGHVVQPLAADFLAVGAPGHEGRVLFMVHRPEDVGVDDDVVPEGDGYVLLEENVAGEGLCSFPADAAFFEDHGFRLVGRAPGPDGGGGEALPIVHVHRGAANGFGNDFFFRQAPGGGGQAGKAGQEGGGQQGFYKFLHGNAPFIPL